MPSEEQVPHQEPPQEAVQDEQHYDQPHTGRWYEQPVSRRVLIGGLLGAVPLAYLSGERHLIGGISQLMAGEPEGGQELADNKLLIAWLPDTVGRWQPQLEAMSQRYAVSANLGAIIMTLESGGGPQAHSNADAKSLMQITPPTEKDIAGKYLKTPRSDYDIWDPATNIEFGFAYLGMLRQEFSVGQDRYGQDASVELIAAGYNGGPGAAGRLYRGEGLTSAETISYSRTAVNMWRERHAADSPTYQNWLARGGSRLVDAAASE